MLFTITATFVLQDSDFFRGASVIPTRFSIRTNDSMTGDRWVVIFIENISYGTESPWATCCHGYFFVAQRLALWNFFDDGIHRVAK